MHKILIAYCNNNTNFSIIGKNNYRNVYNYDEHEIKDVPYYSYSFANHDTSYVSASTEIHEWLSNHNIPYSLDLLYNDYGWEIFIIIENENDAIMFKMIYGC